MQNLMERQRAYYMTPTKKRLFHMDMIFSITATTRFQSGYIYTSQALNRKNFLYHYMVSDSESKSWRIFGFDDVARG